MKGKICLVTGANAGIGLETVRGLAVLGAEVVMACRSLEKGESARQALMASTGNAHIHVMALDLASQRDVRRFAKAFLERFPRLDVLVNNAGAFYADYEKTEDGIERQFAVNHISPFLLTHLLLPALQAAAPARIVMVSSGSHYNGKLDFADLGNEKKYAGFTAYGQSKLCNVLFANEFGRRFPNSGVTANSLHPGMVRTEIGQKTGNRLLNIASLLLWPFQMPMKKGAETSLYVATAPELAGVTGRYYDKSREKTPSALAQDPALAKRLWEISLQLCGLQS